MVDGLAFLPVADVAAGMRHLQQCVPAGDANDRLMALLTYFDVTYVSGTARRVQRPTQIKASRR